MSTATQETIGLKSDAPETPVQEPIVLTEKAAKEVKKIIADQVGAGETRQLHLRMRVVGGGCSGFQHKLDLDPEVNAKLDAIFEMQGVPVVIDKRSLLYLDGVTVDFHDDLNKRGFSISNPQAKGTCGCGSSFSM
jgi:iron-sulfur cluster assembly accessory protein